MSTDLRKCKWCGLHKTRTQVILGAGSLHADIMFIGESPSKVDDERGVPFSMKCDTGSVFHQMIEFLGLSKKKVWRTFVCKCRPVDMYEGKTRSRVPSKDEIDTCSSWLDLEIEKIQPKIIVVLGGTALFRVTKLTGVNNHKGRFISVYDKKYKVFCTYSPAYMSYMGHNDDFRKSMIDDLTVLKKGIDLCLRKR